jgi:hypothetical protein
MVQPLRSDRQKAAIGRDSHDRLRDAERDDLRVCGATRGVVLPLRQEIVSRDENGREQQVEVGVHRGLQGRRCELVTFPGFRVLLGFEWVHWSGGLMVMPAQQR